MTPTESTTLARSSVVEICSRLLSIDSSNYGPALERTVGERAVADYVLELLTGAGYEPTLLESAPGRANVLLRVPGTESGLEAFLVHGHMDVVPAEPDQWSLDPFSGLVEDGYIWGRGATDMKDMVANMLATLLAWKAHGTGPRRDVVFAFVADEEVDGQYGAEWLVATHPEWFDGVAAAISEGGGVPVEQEDVRGNLRRFYPVSAAERGTMHMTLSARGPSGHGSRPEADNAVTHLVDALASLAHHPWPISLIPASRAFLEGTTKHLGVEADLSTDAGIEAALASIGDALRGDVRPSSRGSLNPTVLRAGYKVNVIPGVAEAEIDVRTVPGTEAAMLDEIDRMLGDRVTREFLSNVPGISAPFDSVWFKAIADSIVAHDPEAIVLPCCLGGGTDAKAFSRLGIDCYGYSPLGQDPEGRKGSGMHGVDERVPVAALEIGAAMLEGFLTEV